MTKQITTTVNNTTSRKLLTKDGYFKSDYYTLKLMKHLLKLTEEELRIENYGCCKRYGYLWLRLYAEMYPKYNILGKTHKYLSLRNYHLVMKYIDQCRGLEAPPCMVTLLNKINKFIDNPDMQIKREVNYLYQQPVGQSNRRNDLNKLVYGYREKVLKHSKNVGVTTILNGDSFQTFIKYYTNGK